MCSTQESIARAIKDRVVILDGATGTELTRRGVPTELPLWSTAALLDHPDVVRDIHAEYLAAGAEIIVANTFRSNERALRAAGLHDRVRELNGLAVALAREAVERVHASRGASWVAGSVGPVEDCYCPERVPDDRALQDEHGRMMTWLAQAGVDLIWIETMNTVREATAAARAARHTGLPLVVSFVVKENGDLLSGECLESAIDAIEPFDPLAVGLNCVPPDGLTRTLPRLRAATTRPLAAYAHLGNPEPISGWSFSRDSSPAAYAEEANKWVAAGVRFVGGCCGTTPAHISALQRIKCPEHPGDV